MSALHYVNSYYAATAHPFVACPPLSAPTTVDVCVVGGGIAGCSTALHLAERGVSVALLEAERIGFGASGRSGGQALPGYAKGQAQIEKLVGKEIGRKLWDISVEGLDLVRGLIQRFHIDCDWVAGQLSVAIKPRQVDELRSELKSLTEGYGYHSVRLIEQRELRDVVASERYLAGLYDSRSGHLHPLNYTLGLARAAQSLGATLYEGTKALRFERRGGRILVDTPGGTVHCKQLVLCGNVYMGDLSRALRSKIMGIGTYIVATEKLGEARARSLIANNAAVTDTNWIIDYFRRSADHRLLFGGRVSYAGLDEHASATLTRARMVRVFPQLEDVKIEYAWGGYLDITLNRAPDFGVLDDGVYYLQGFAGHGISLTGMAGKMVADAIMGKPERFDLFSHIKHRTFPGGQAFRRPALVLAMLYYRARDWL